MNLSSFSVKNSLLVNVMTVFILFVGLFALTKIEREAFPNFSFDIVTVKTDYRGAPPEVMEKRITIPLENELKEVDGIDEMGSVSVEGLSLLILQIDPDAEDKNRVFNDIQRAVEEANDLPDDLADEPLVREIQTKDTPLVEVSLSGELPEGDIRRLALNLENELLDLPGVASVARKGMRDREIWVEVDPKKLESEEISLQHVIASLAAQNVNMAGGLQKGIKDELILRISGEFEGAEDVRQVVLRANETGNWVQVSDVAEVKDSFEEVQVIQRTDGTRAINLLVIKKDRADAIRLMDDLKALTEDFQKKSPPELRIGFVNDISYYIKRRLNVLVSNGWIGLLFVIIPMVIFLSWRVALGAAIGMATALLAAIAVMYAFGISINLISMFGMIMVLGMLVDEDLVVADNTTRYLEKGFSHEEAAIRGASEVSRAVVSTVLTTIIAFIPLLMMSGIFGKFVSNVPKVVIIVLTASLIQALVILPSHLSDLNRPLGKKGGYQKKRQHHLYDRFREYYLRSLRASLRRPILTTMVSFLIAGGAILYAIFGMRFILFPSRGIEAFFLRAEAPVGTPIEVTEKMMGPLEKLVSSLPKEELEHLVTQVGIMQNDPSDPFTTRGSHVAQIEVYLTPPGFRNRDAEEIMNDLRGRLLQDGGFTQVRLDEVKPGPPVGRPVAVRIRGDEYETILKVAEVFKEDLRQRPGVKDVRDDFERGKGELIINVDERAASQAGLSYRDIALTVRQAFEGMKATTIRRTEDEIDVVVRLPEKLRHDPKAIETLLIPTRTGHMIPLNRVARLEEGPGISVIKHFDRKRAVTVSANIDEYQTTSREVNAALREKFAGLESQYPGYRIHYGGEEEDTEESLRSFFYAFYVAILLSFIVLIVTFESFTQALVVLMAIPLSVLGVVLGLSLQGQPFTFMAIMGCVGLTGIVIDSGTLIFVFVNRLRKEGLELKEAIIEGCGIRLRSVLLTTLTTVVGVIPAAYGIGGSDPFIQPMALALNWGIAFSVLPTLYSLPSLYYLVEKGIGRIKVKILRNP